MMHGTSLWRNGLLSKLKTPTASTSGVCMLDVYESTVFHICILVLVIKLLAFQAEIAMREDGKPGMSNEEVLDFVSVLQGLISQHSMQRDQRVSRPKASSSY